QQLLPHDVRLAQRPGAAPPRRDGELRTPRDSTIRTGYTARLECAAEGHPAPQIAWQKDGGTDFPAARERRMHVMPDDDVFFITDVKPEDMGVYSCTAKNTAGTVSANATLTVLGKRFPRRRVEIAGRSVGNRSE
uniref:Ig-like domain-containing protein n=1 Tax=Xiphophorus couchianus TaxID=32473 RepID=A0A3B5MF81_9TELE